MTLPLNLTRGGALALLLFLLSFSKARSQQSDLNFINFNNKDGLSSSSVNDIVKDSYGYVWAGTDDGLNKFDGANFKVYRHDDTDSTSISGNSISAFFEDHDKNLWIGTNNTLSLYDRKRDAFINYGRIIEGTIRGIFADHHGNVWVGGYFGLCNFNPRTGKVIKFRKEDPRTDALLSNTVLCVFEDSRHRIWVGTNAGLNQYIPETGGFVKHVHSDSVLNSIADNVVRVVAEDPNGNVWFGTNNGLSKLEASGNGFITYKHNKADPSTLSSNQIYTIRSDYNGHFWIGTEEGLNIFDIKSQNVRRILSDQRRKYDIVGKSVRTICIDGSGIYWVGTFHGGLNKYDKNLAFFNLQESNPLDPQGLSSSFVTSLVEDDNGDIYVGTDGGGLNLYHRKSGLFEHPKIGREEDIKGLSVLAMEKVGNELWIGTYQKGIYVLNLKTGKSVQYVKTGQPGSMRSNEVFCLKKDSKGNVWVGTNGSGVDIYDPQSGKFYSPLEAAKAAGAGVIINGFVRAIEEDRAGNIWIGSTGAGVCVYNPVKKEFRLFNTENSNLPSNVVLSIFADGLNNIWVGTQGEGLSMFDAKTDQFISYSGHEGLSNSVIYKILEDNEGQLWVTTNKGLSSFNRNTKRFRNYFYQNGLQRGAFSRGSGLKTSNGEMFFGGLNGFNYFNPLTLNSNKNIPLLQLTALKISNRTVIPGEDESISEPVSEAKEIHLDYKQNFSLDFIALNYTTPQETRYAYKLEGFDNDWNPVKNNPTANYTNLDPGNYVFRVKAISEDGSWSTPEKTIKIYVKPPFWRTGYAYAAYALIAILIIIIIRYQAVHKLKRKYAIEQERMEVKQLIEQERKESERQHKFDQLKIKFLTNLSHEFRTPISLIVGPVEKLLNKEESYENRNELSMVKRNANRLLNLVNQLLDLRKIEETELKLNLANGDLVSFVKEIAGSFKSISEEKAIDFSFSSQLQKCQLYFDFHKIERVLLNLLSNAFKFTNKGGRIEMGIEMEGSSFIKIKVSDSGIGITKEVQDKIFDRFFQDNQDEAILNSGSGIGLSIAQEFAKLHGGEITVNSTPGKGSCFTLLLPFKPAPDPVVTIDESSEPVILPVPHQQANGKKEPLLKDLTVLLIEDNEDFRQYLKNSLSPFYKIVEACDGKEGWQKVLACHPQVIVSDITMPHMDGISLSRKIKKDKRTSHIPVILLTAIGGEANQLKGLQTGASDYLTKPFNFELLKIKIENLVTLNENFKNTYRRQLNVKPAEQVIGESEDRKLMGRITEYIENNIDSPELSVEDVSRHLFMSRGSLYAKMLELSGEKPVEFIRSLRLNKAAVLLEKSDMKIAQIAYAVGFSSPNHFARAFKIKFNISPSEYMLQKRGMGNSDPVPTLPA